MENKKMKNNVTNIKVIELEDSYTYHIHNEECSDCNKSKYFECGKTTYPSNGSVKESIAGHFEFLENAILEDPFLPENERIALESYSNVELMEYLVCVGNINIKYHNCLK